MENPKTSNDKPRPEFETLAERSGRTSASPLGEFSYLVRRTRKYWMLPIIVGLMAVGFLVATGGTAIAPIIYTLF